MTAVASVWLVLVGLFYLYAWFRRAWLLPIVAVAALALAAAPLSHPAFWQPPTGQYTLVGAKIVPQVGIWVLLDSGKDEPAYYKLPYSNKKANALQKAMDKAHAQGGNVGMRVGGEGAVGFDSQAPQDDAPKQEQQPMFNSGEASN